MGSWYCSLYLFFLFSDDFVPWWSPEFFANGRCHAYPISHRFLFPEFYESADKATVSDNLHCSCSIHMQRHCILESELKHGGN